MNGKQAADLHYSRHLQRNAVEDYTFLTDRGVTHDAALARVGLTQEQWLHMQAADDTRVDQGTAA